MMRIRYAKPKEIVAIFTLSAGCLLSLSLQSPPARAGENSNAKILLHLTAPVAKNTCVHAGVHECRDIITSGDLYPRKYFAYVVVADVDALEGVTGIKFGLQYDGRPHEGVDIYSWESCSNGDWTTMNWPASGSGAILTWKSPGVSNHLEADGAESNVTRVAGYFYCAAYSNDTLRPVGHPSDGTVAIMGSHSHEETLATQDDGNSLGHIKFSAGGLEEGYNPCGNGIPGRASLFTIAHNSRRPMPAQVAATIVGGGVQFDLALPGASRVAAEIVDIAGRLVFRIPEQSLEAGDRRLTWPVGLGANDRAAGLYFYKFLVNGSAISGKIVLTK